MEILREEKASGSVHYRDTIKITFRSPYDGLEDWALIERGRTSTWVIMLHGHGSQGDQLFTRQDVATQWLPFLRDRGLGILSPNLRGNAWMCRSAVSDLRDLVAFVRRKYDVKAFIFATGSMGGTGALIYAVNHPEDIAGVCALCSATDIGRYYAFCRANTNQLPVLDEIAAAIEKSYGGTPETAPANYRTNSTLNHAARLGMPIYLCHGDNDPNIPVEESRTLVAALEKHGKKHIYVELKGGHHDSPIPELPKGIDWLLEQTMTGNTRKGQ